MDVRVIEEPGRTQLAIDIYCAPSDPRVAGVARALRSALGHLWGYADGSTTRQAIDLDRIATITTDGDHARILCTDGHRYESPQRLFELELALAGTEFTRASRQTLVNFDKVEAIRPEPYGRLTLKLEGGGFAAVSRTYAAAIKEKIGIIGEGR